MYVILPVLTIALMVFVLADIISGGPEKFKNLDKVWWVIIVIILPLVGSILWFLVGREYNGRDEFISFGDSRRADAVGFTTTSPTLSSTEAELAALDREIAAYEKDQRIRRLEAEIEAKRAKGLDSL
jgi:hypothetical protein